MLFSDIASATVAEGRDEAAWRDVLHAHDGVVRRTLEIFDGHELKAIGGGLTAIFDLPVDGVRCALRLREAARALGIQLRTGVHTGEIELRGSDVCGTAVQLCRRLLDVAGPGEVVVTQTVVELAGGSQVGFEPRGKTRLRGVPGAFRLFRASEEPSVATRNPATSPGAYRNGHRTRLYALGGR